MEQNNDTKKQAEYGRLAGIAFIGAGTAWLAAGVNRPLAVSILALGIIFLAINKNKKQ